MSEYLLDREHFSRLLNGEHVGEQDYVWSFFQRDMVLGRDIYLRDHIPSCFRTFWIIDSFDTERAVMVAIKKVTQILHAWVRV